MNDWFEKNKKPLGQAISIFGLLFGSVILLTVFYDFSEVSLGVPLFLMAFLCCVLVAKNIFDVSRLDEVDDETQEEQTFDLTLASEELYVQLYEKSPVPYLIIDSVGNIKSANTAATRMLGVPVGQFVGINIFERIRCEDDNRLEVLQGKYQNNLAVSSELVEVKRDDIHEYWALMSLFPLNNFAGEKIGLMAMMDITKQKKAEDAKSEFVSLASHQLRTPIAGMKWSTELLMMDSGSLSDKQKKYADRLLASVKRMAVLVDDFLRVSRFELGTFTPEFGPVSLSAVCEDVMLELDERTKQKNIKVETFFTEEIDKIITDQNLVRMIITNLYSNSVKYTREGGTIHIGFARSQDNLAITVADNGIGIPDDDQEEIFSKLFRASNAVRDVPDGTGLGLYIVREAVAVLQGNVTFKSDPDNGTTFEVILPLKLAEEAV